MHLKNKKAFTFIEVLIILSIIGIIAAIAIPNIMVYNNKTESVEKPIDQKRFIVLSFQKFNDGYYSAISVIQDSETGQKFYRFVFREGIYVLPFKEGD